MTWPHERADLIFQRGMDILQTCTEVVVVMMTSHMGSQRVLALGAVLCDVVCSEFSRMSSAGFTEPNCTRFHAVWHLIKPTSPPFLIWCRLAGCCSLTALCCKTGKLLFLNDSKQATTRDIQFFSLSAIFCANCQTAVVCI